MIDNSGQKFLLKARNYKEVVAYDSAEYFFKRAIDCFATKEKWDLYIIAQTELGTLNRIQGKIQIANSILNELYFHKEFKLTNYPNGYAEYMHLKGTLIGDAGQFDLAISTLDSVIFIRKERSDSDTLLAKTFNNLGAYYYFLNKINKASKLYEKALASEQARNNPKSEDIASYLINIGSMYSYKGDFDEALLYFNKALELNEKRLNTNDPEIADLYYNLAVNYRKLGQFNNALKYLKKAELIYLEYGKDFSSLNYIYLSSGEIYFDKLDYNNASIYYQNILKINNNSYTSSPSQLLSFYYKLGLIYRASNNNEYALEYFNLCLPLSENIGYAYRLKDIATVYHQNNQEDLAFKYIQLAINRIEKDFGNSKINLSDMHFSKAQFLFENGYIEKALVVIKHVIQLNSTISISDNVLARNYTLFAKILVKSGFYRQALKHFQLALILNHHVFDNENILENPKYEGIISKSLYLSIILGKADALINLFINENPKLEYLYACIENFQSALNIFEEMKSFAGETSQLNLSRLNKNQFDKIYLALEQLYSISNDSKYIELAFKYAEKFKASLLLSSIKETEAIKFGGIPENLQRLENDLDQRISGYNRLIYDENNNDFPDSLKIAIWEENLFYVNHQYNQLIDSFRMHYDDYYSLNFNKDVISIAEVQKHIDQDQLLINYKLTDTLLFTITINSDTTKFFKTKIDSNFYNNLKIIEGLAHTDFSNHRMKDFYQFVNASHSLFKTLIEPISDDIKEKRLIIVPDGRLGYLPFETLIYKLPTSKRMDYRNLNYLIKTNPVSYTYSSTLLYRNFKEFDASMKLLAFAPEYEQFDESEDSDLSTYFMPLINAVIEVENISAIYNGDAFLNNEATETKFKEIADDYDIIHLAMHTMIDNEKPMYSKLVFSKSNDTINDRFLNTYELYGLELKAKMVVLSACNTGSGKIEEGEGIMSLARGFIYAGVPSIIMTLWEVEDKSGADIMTLFYQKLKKGLPKDIALQQAKLDYLESATQLRSHPYFWLAYVDIGNTKAFKRTTYNSEIGYSIVVIFIILFTTILRKRHKKKSTV